VAIRFVLPEQESESVAFAYSPVVEAVLSLHVLVAPRHHPLQHAWVRRMRRLDPRLKAEIKAFRFAYAGHFPDFLFPRPDEEFLEFEEELAFLHDLEPETLAFEFMRPVYDHTGTWPRERSLLESEEVRRHVLERCARYGPESQALGRLVFDDPSELGRRFCSLSSATGRRRSKRNGPRSSRCSPKRSRKRAGGSRPRAFSTSWPTYGHSSGWSPSVERPGSRSRTSTKSSSRPSTRSSSRRATSSGRTCGSTATHPSRCR
jgi:hypothetical protein